MIDEPDISLGLPHDARTDDVTKFFEGFGRIVDVRVMTGFGFIEFESSRDAEDAVHQFNGKNFMGANIVVEFAKESRPRRERDTYEADRAPRARRPPGYRVIVSGISRDTSWQDLKDFGREAGNVSFADIDRDNVGEGILEYLTRDDAERAVKELDGKDLRGQPVRVNLDADVSTPTEQPKTSTDLKPDRPQRAGPDNYRREERRDDRRDDRYRDDRPREDRYAARDERPPPRARERSRSPPRRTEFDDRRPRSPPPKRDFEDRRPAGDDDRRRDDRRREDERYDDRQARHANGDSGWGR